MTTSRLCLEEYLNIVRTLVRTYHCGLKKDDVSLIARRIFKYRSNVSENLSLWFNRLTSRLRLEEYFRSSSNIVRSRLSREKTYHFEL
jgi:hypothetical protein